MLRLTGASRNRVRLALLLSVLCTTACGAEHEAPDIGGDVARAPIRINGMGATLPYPLYSKWFAEYNRLHPEVQINYQSQGSGAGIRGVLAGTIFFGASDQPLKSEQAASANVLHFPTVLSAVVPVYNLPGDIRTINFTGPVLADIVLGRITKWNDPAIAVHNPDVPLPSTDITVVHRADGSGTTFVWADYLSKVSPAFRTTVGVDASLQWPTGIGAKGNEGMAGVIRQIPGAFGYVELVWARQNGLAYGAVQNAAGAFVTASRETISAAAEARLPDMAADFRISMTNGLGRQSYPIASFSWMLIQKHPEDAARGRIMREFLRWALTDGQRYASDLGYAVLPRPLVEKELEMLDALQ